MDTSEMVLEFMGKFGQSTYDELVDLRTNMFTEELREFAKAYGTGDIVEMFDAVLDLTYVQEGTIQCLHPLDEQSVIQSHVVINCTLSFSQSIGKHLMDEDFMEMLEEGFAEVHRSNMSKLGEDGKPIYREDGKVLKGPNYTPPNLVPILEKYGVL